MSLLRVRRLTPDDWQAYKHIRLRALATDPAAFSSTFAREENRADDEWRARLARSAVFIGEVDGAEVGLVGGIHLAGGIELVSMWVAPGARGSGIAARLIEAVTGWASDAGHEQVRLWVVEGNVAAEKAYAKSGFALTGRRQPVRDGEPAMEQEMVRATSSPQVRLLGPPPT
jgi:GNAT superfamily N-acetyltransferase